MIAVMVRRQEGGTYEIIGEPEAWDQVQAAAAQIDAEIRAGDPLTGWGPYTRVYDLLYPDWSVRTYFVAEEGPQNVG